MVDDFAVQEVRSSGELWSEICSSLPEVGEEASEGKTSEFRDSFQPAAPAGEQLRGRCDGTDPASTKWEPMEDSDVYIASLGTSYLTWNTNGCFVDKQKSYLSYMSLLNATVGNKSQLFTMTSKRHQLQTPDSWEAVGIKCLWCFREPSKETKGAVQWCDVQGNAAFFVSSQEGVLGPISPRCPDLWALPRWRHGWKVG